VPGTVGELGIYPRHAPLIASLAPGVVRLHAGATVERFGIRGGFLHVKKDVVTLLIADAVKPSDLDPAKLEAEEAAVLESLRHPRSEEEFQELLTQRKWCEVRRALLSEGRSASKAH
jgi:F-type H+-transporting ATPase subunit epsilon